MQEDKILFFVKFGKKEHLEELADGKVYFSNSRCFNKIEKEQIIRGQGDLLDGRMIINANNAEMIEHISNEKIRLGKVNLNIGVDGVEKMPVFCLTAGFFDDCKNYSSVDKYKIKFNEKKEKVIREHFKDADSALLIEKPNDLIKSITRTFDAKCYSELVHYFDMSTITIDRIEYMHDISFNPNNIKTYSMTNDNAYRLLYCKDKFFIEQQEFRFVVPEITLESPKIFQVGKNFKSRLLDIDDFFNGVEVR